MDLGLDEQQEMLKNFAPDFLEKGVNSHRRCAR